jgi:hypothetical protein
MLQALVLMFGRQYGIGEPESNVAIMLIQLPTALRAYHSRPWLIRVRHETRMPDREIRR